MNEIEKAMWKYVRGDSSTGSFKEWIHSYESLLQENLDKGLFHDLANSTFSKKREIDRLKTRMTLWLDSLPGPKCKCRAWRSHQRISIQFDTADILEDDFIRLASTELHSLEVAQCKVCGQNWYVRTDDDIENFYFERISKLDSEKIIQFDSWPTHYKDIDKLKVFEGKRFHGLGLERHWQVLKYYLVGTTSIELFPEEKIVVFDHPLGELYHRCSDSEWQEFMDFLAAKNIPIRKKKWWRVY
jgi:hypothetical protein